MATRKYESELRVEQARLTRRRILDRLSASCSSGGTAR